MRYDKLAEVLGLSVKDVKTMVREMADRFTTDNTHHGIQLLMYPTTCQLTTKEQYRFWNKYHLWWFIGFIGTCIGSSIVANLLF